LASALALTSRNWPRLCSSGLGLIALASALASRFWPHLTSLVLSSTIVNSLLVVQCEVDNVYKSRTVARKPRACFS